MVEHEAQMQQKIEDARRAFRGRCRSILKKAYSEADSISAAIGEISVDEAFDGWINSFLQIAESTKHDQINGSSVIR